LSEIYQKSLKIRLQMVGTLGIDPDIAGILAVFEWLREPARAG